MLAAQRHAIILQAVSQNGAARISELAASLQVSEMTVRRDLDNLAEQGLLDKVHGGATAVVEESSVIEPPFKAKSLREQALKNAIALEAASLVKPGASIALMGGSTVFAMAQHLLSTPRLTVVTNSLPVSDYFQKHQRPDRVVILTGGLRTPTDSLVGDLALAAFDKFNVDIAFIGTHGMDPKGGLSSPNLMEAETNKAVRERAKQLVILADHTKWGSVGFATFAQLSDVNVLISDDQLSDDAAEALRHQVGNLVLAGLTKK